MASQIENMGQVAKPKSASRKQLLELVAMQHFKCALSGVELLPDNAELDHIIPVSFGGDSSIDNLQVVCKEINRMKSNLTQEDFVRLCVTVAQHSGHLVDHRPSHDETPRVTQVGGGDRRY